MNIGQATKEFETWIGGYVPVVRKKQLYDKHRLMAKDPVQFCGPATCIRVTISTPPRSWRSIRTLERSRPTTSTIRTILWDWDEVEAPMLIDLQKDGQTIKSLVHPGRDAIFWVLERSPDRIKFVSGWPFVYTNVWKSVDPETGKLFPSTPSTSLCSASGSSSVRRCMSPELAVGRLQPGRRTWSTCQPRRGSVAALPASRNRSYPVSYGSAQSPRISV